MPKKLYVYASHYAEGFHEAAGFGLQTESLSFDWPTLRDNKIREISRLNGIYEKMLLNAGCTLIQERATVVGPHEVKVGDKTYSAERILVAVGGWPFVPDIPGAEHIISSNEVFDLDRFPDKVIVVGGGYIAVEFAGIFAGLGAETHLVHRGELFLKGFDQEVREFTAREVAKKGVQLHFNTNLTGIEKRLRVN